MLPVMHVGATNAGEGNFDKNGAGVREGRDWTLFIGDVEGRV